MVEFVVVLHRPGGGIAQSWGPFESEPAAKTARDRLASWPALDGEFEIVPMVRLIEPTPAAPVAPVPMPWQPVQPLPNIPNWPYPQPYSPIIWCQTNVPDNTRRMALTPEAVSRNLLGSGAVTPPSFWQTVTVQPDGAGAWTSTAQTLGRIDFELRDNGDEEDPPAAVAAKL